jgi:hypothetical protein
LGLKFFRLFVGGYNPDSEKIKSMGYTTLKLPRPLFVPVGVNQGFGQIKGVIKKLGGDYSRVPVCIFKKSNRQLLWETKSKSDGSYSFRNIAKELECFVVAFDPNNQYNAVIQDNVVPK